MYITTLLRCFLSVESDVVNISQQRSTKSRPFDPDSSVTFSSDVSWHRALWVSLYLCAVYPFCRNSAAILPQFCRNSAAICRNGVLIVLWCIECIHSKIFQISHRIWQMCTACTLQEERPSAPGTDQRPSVVRTDPSEASLIPFRMEDRKETGEVKRSEKK